MSLRTSSDFCIIFNMGWCLLKDHTRADGLLRWAFSTGGSIVTCKLILYKLAVNHQLWVTATLHWI